MNAKPVSKRIRLLGLLAALAIPALFYIRTLQTIPNGSSHYFMIDVGETQVVLNVWGTLHATGYPHYVITGSALTEVLTALGVNPATAPALVSLLWGLLALALLYALLLHLSGGQNPLPAAGVTVLYGLTRTVWVHNAIAEIYTFGLLILIGLLALALWREGIPRLTTGPARLYALALLGGIGVAHHRAVATAIPALLYATWPTWKVYVTGERRRLPVVLATCLILGLIGFLPYIYLPLRDAAEAAWVYGSPGSWDGFWHEFFGREASRFIGPPETSSALVDNFHLVNRVIAQDLTGSGLGLGLLGLIFGLRSAQTRHIAGTVTLMGMGAYAFHVLLYSDVLSALILPITLAAAFGWYFMWLEGRELIAKYGAIPSIHIPLPDEVVPVGLACAMALIFVVENDPFIHDLTRDTTGLDTIAEVEAAPPGSTVMLAWGPRHFAVGFAQDVQGRLGDITLVDHNAPFADLLADGAILVTPQYTLFNQPPDWWAARIGSAPILRASGPGLVQIDTQIATPTDAADLSEGPAALRADLTCEPDAAILEIDWYAAQTPERDLSVFVHLLDANGTVIAQDDRSAPVYGWRPLSSWRPGEVVRDVYALPRLPDEANVRYGLYYQADDGAFVNVVEMVREACEGG